MKILSVEDTRAYGAGTDGRFHPIPGSGRERMCDRCGRTHEIHVTVFDGNRTAVVGLGCAMQDEMLTANACHCLGSTAKTLARLEAERLNRQTKLATQHTAWAAILAMPLPPVTFVRAAGYAPGDTWALMGYARVLCNARDGFTKERQACLLSNWRNCRLREQTGETVHEDLAEKVAALTAKLARTRTRLAGLLAAEAGQVPAGNSAAGSR